jgi:quinol monooxygenase YgiN
MIMAEPFIFINTYAIKPGKEEEYRKRFQEVADIVQAEEPRMLYFAHHESEDGSESTTVQVHAHPDNMAFHMQLVGEHIRQSAQYLDFSSMSVRIYGAPSDAVLDQMRQLAGSGVSVTVSPAVVAFDRFAES